MFIAGIQIVRTVRDVGNRLSPRSVVEYEQHGRPILGAIREERRNKWLVVNERGQELELPADRLTLLPESVPSDRGNATAMGEFLSSVVKHAEAIANDLDLEEVWQVFAESSKEVSVVELTELALQTNSLVNHVAMRRKLLTDDVFFKRKKTGFEPRPQEVVEELKVKAAVERKRAEERRLLQQAVIARIRGDNVDLPPEVALLEQFAASGSQADQAKESLELVDEIISSLKLPITGKPEERAFEVLVRAKVFSPDEDLTLLKMGRSKSFSPALEEEASRLASTPWRNDDRRVDLTSLWTVAIDSTSTRDVDDALSIERIEGGWRVGIHISDVESVIPEDSILMREIMARGTSIYTPDYQIPMLPRSLSEGVLSLLEGELRLVMSFFVEVSSSGVVKNRRVERATIRVTRQLSYDVVDGVLYGESLPADLRDDAWRLQDLWDVACICEARRLERGAIQFSRRELSAVVSTDGRVHLEETGEETPARKLVSEMMILANETAAMFAQENRIPIVFRSQAKPDVIIAEQGLDIPEGPAREFVQRGFLKRSIVGTEPGSHAALGLDAYTQVTSPIRRAGDLLTQRQLSSFRLNGRPRYSAEELQQLLSALEVVLDEASYLQRGRNRYWLLKYLQQEDIREIDAVIVRVDTPKPLAELEVVYAVFPFHTAAKPGAAEGRARLGERIRLRIDEIRPRRELLLLSEI